jgi:hypothetical protein
MKYIKPCVLVGKKIEGGQDALGNQKFTENRRKVIVSEKSVRQSEFYKSHQEGVQVEIVLEIRTILYKGEMKAIYKKNGVEEIYRILRTYDLENGFIELMLTKEGVENG